MPGLSIGRRAAMMMGVAAGVAGCQAAPPVSVPMVLSPDRGGYMLFTSVIDAQSAQFFIGNIDRMLALDATAIHIGISSPGGVVKAAEDMIAKMDRVHAERGVTFTTYNTGVVGSAACYVFLAGQRRYSSPRSAFIFHQAGIPVSGVLTGQAMQEGADILKQDERVFLQMLKTHTKIPEAEALSFVHRTVILTPDEAKRDGVIEGTSGFVVPTGATIVVIRPKTPTTPARPGAPQG